MDELLERIAKEILGEVLTESTVLEKYDLEISEEELLEEMLDWNIELCSSCGTWKESCEIDPDEQNVICFECIENYKN